MKAIKHFFIVLVCIIFGNGCTKQNDDFTANYNFIRFGLLLDVNNNPIQFPAIRPELREVNIYKTDKISDIKIPIIMTSLLQDKPTEVIYEVVNEGNFFDFTISPSAKITIPAGKLVDTIRIKFNSRWTIPDTNKIKLKIISTSNPDLKIGWNNRAVKLDQITIVLGNLDVRKYNFLKNIYTISGQANEELLIPIQFSQPISNASIGSFNFVNAEFSSFSLCDATSNAFQYTITREPFADGATTIFYKLKILQTISQPTNLKLTLNAGLPNYVPTGITATFIRKDSNTSVGNPAANWYNTADVFYRTFGKSWYFNATDNRCRWQNFFALTKPVPVPAGSIYDNGQGFHKFKIGFVGNAPPIGTNPFDFTRFYNGTSTESPAFTIPEAIEFFPDNGNSAAGGTVKIIPQIVTFIKLSNDAPVQVPICGSGNYYFNSAFNRWEMFLEIRCDESAINGNNNAIKRMYIYSNNNNTANPPNLTAPCPSRISL